jgi:CheY-like chemotaxis protein
VDIDLSKVTVIAVEDDLSGMALMGMMLRRIGMQAYVDPSGDHVVQMALSLKPDIILLDIHLPGRTGFDLLKDIRNAPELHHTPVIAVTAMDAMTALTQCRAAGFQGYVAKPVRSQYLAKQIRRVLAGEEVWDTSYAVR